MDSLPIHMNCKDECDIHSNEKQPLYFIRPFKEKSGFAFLRALSRELKWLGKQSEAQKLFTLIAINLTGTIILLVWCRITSSLALLAYTYLSWFNFLSLLTWLLRVWLSSQAASPAFTFGLSRCEVLSVFASVILTLLGALFILKESLERFILPQEVHVEHLSCVALAGLLLNVSMTALTQNPPLTHVLRCATSSLLQEHVADMCHSVCFQLPGLRRLLLPRLNPLNLISIVGFVFIVSDHVIVQVYNYSRCDTIVAFLIALLTISTMLPLCLCSANLLLQTIPPHYSAHLDQCLREALTLDGVLEFHSEKFWVLGVDGGHPSSGAEGGKNTVRGVPGLEEWGAAIVVGTLQVRVRRDASEQAVLAHVRRRLAPYVHLLTVQVFKDDWTRSNTTLRLLKDCGVSPPSSSSSSPPSPSGDPKLLPFHSSTNSFRSSALTPHQGGFVKH